MELKKQEEALADFSKAIVLNPSNKEAYLDRVNCYSWLINFEA